MPGFAPARRGPSYLNLRLHQIQTKFREVCLPSVWKRSTAEFLKVLLFRQKDQNHFRPCASLRGPLPPYRITWLRNSLCSDSARRKVGFGTAARPHPKQVGGNKSKKDQRDFAGVLNPKQGSGIWRSRRLFLKPQLFSDQVTEAFLGFRVTWDRSMFAGSWISINVVFLSVSFQIASCGNQLPNEIPSLHATSTVMSFLFIPGCSSEGSASIIKL